MPSTPIGANKERGDLFPRLRILQADAAREPRFPVRAVPLCATGGKLVVVQPKELIEVIASKRGNLKHARSPFRSMIARAASHGYPLLALEVGYAGTGGKMPIPWTRVRD